MNIELKQRPGATSARVLLGPGEQMTAEGGAMIAMSGNISMETTTYKKNKGGIMKGLKRVFSGESFFMNHYTADVNGGEVYLAPTLHGDISVHELSNEQLIVQGGSYLASEPEIEVDFSWQGMKSIFSGEGLFWLNLNGTGKVLINAYGCIYPVEIDGEYIVDTGHIVAFTPGLSFKISKAGVSWMSSILGGEGLVCRFKGKGTLWCQSHNPNSFGSKLGSGLKPI
ncbi:MAG: TIGR00266 family protein [Bacteroidia bacterium]|nr:TIGR00266 family protein [Bacteroidia bacterium]